MRRCEDGVIISKAEFMTLGTQVTADEVAEMAKVGDNPGANLVVMMQSMSVVAKLAKMIFESEENGNEGTRN